MRKYKQSVVIKVVFGVIVLSFIGTIFLVWGKGDEGLKGSSGYAVKVDRTRVGYDDYQQSYNRVRNIFQQMYGSVTPDMEKRFGIRKTAIDSLINRVLIKRESQRMGISVSKDEVAKEISAITAFQKDGVFNFDLYQQMLKSQRLTPAAFEEAQKEELIIKKTRDKIASEVTVSDDDLLKQFKQDNDTVDLLYITFSPFEMDKEVKLTDQDLTAYLQGHQEDFRTPEQISVSYLVVDPAAFTGKVTVTDEEANTYYQKHIDRYQGKGGILPFTEVRDQVKKDTLADRAAKLAYEKAAEAINKYRQGGDLAAAAQSLGVRTADTPLFSLKTPPPALAGETEVASRAFSLKPGELGGPVETAKGIYILKLKEKKPSVVPPLAQVRARVEDLARETKAKELAKRKAEEAIAQLGKGPGSYRFQETGPFLYKNGPAKIGSSPELIEAAFKLTPAAPVAPTPFKVGEAWYVIKLKSRNEASKEEFQKQKESIRKSILPKKQEEAVDKWLQGLRSKAKIVINPALAAE